MPTLKFRAKRAAVVIVAAASLVGLAGCQMGFKHATLTQYTQAEGINLDLANGGPVAQGTGYVKVRNLMIIAFPDGSARLSGVIYGSPSSSAYQVGKASTPDPKVDTLQSANGKALKPNGDQGGALTVSLPQPLPIVVKEPVQLQDQNITVTGAKLTPGVDAELTLTFAKNGRVTSRVPVVDGTKPDFATMTPVSAASGSASASASPSASATPAR
ncbi:hypothetical protein GA0111570_10266 [Raineyella antarctica]|uniref:Copper(I)-binding protein n=1 Tax=Raineyella antarctica TaxID=1577474 RepID=A0A1G6GE76_9ACTN|nr:hypothetical protein [Raineyella antarctica]SDB80280.1 hypothetical protein GA0111570_10266 [Raineyella antarctica]